MSRIELKILDPSEDIELFREAYSWRRHKKHTGANEATLEDLLDDDPRQTTIGVFNGQYCAMFLLYEDEPGKFNAHFTSKRGTSRETLIKAGEQIRDAFFENGAVELCAWVTSRNRALKGYLDALGFVPVCHKTFPCQNDTDSDTLPADESEPPTRMFTKYALRGEPQSD